MKSATNRNRDVQHRASDGFFRADHWRPNGVKALKRLTVIGPYPTKGFFRQFLKRYMPQEILLVVDDGWNRDEIIEIHRCCHRANGREPLIRCASCWKKSGLLHAKIYLAEWGSGSTAKTQLLWGSLNASLNGFQINSEVASEVTLDTSSEKMVRPYFEQLWKSEQGAVKPLRIALPGGIQVHFPGFRFWPLTYQRATFDGWVQSGRLCHSFQRDPSFARLSIRLKKALPKEGLEAIFKDQGLKRDTETNTLRYAYVGETEADDPGHWRATYFVETWLGFWTSDSCYRTMGREFSVKNTDQREAEVEQIKNSTDAVRAQWCDALIDRIRAVCAALGRRRNDQPADYFYMRPGGDIDEALYRKNALIELERHRERALDDVFVQRFVRGYVFPPLPRFRGTETVDEGSFEGFLESFCQTIADARTKNKGANRLIRAIHRCYGTRDLGDTGKQVLSLLRRDWHTIGERVEHFYERK